MQTSRDPYPRMYIRGTVPRVMFISKSGDRRALKPSSARFCKSLAFIHGLDPLLEEIEVPMLTTPTSTIELVVQFCERFEDSHFGKPRIVSRSPDTGMWSIVPFVPAWAAQIVWCDMDTECIDDVDPARQDRFFASIEALYVAANTLRIDPLESLVQWRINTLLLNSGSKETCMRILDATRSPIASCDRFLIKEQLVQVVDTLKRQKEIRDTDHQAAVLWPDA